MLIGARLGPYEVLAKLGEGGMGEVYRARDTKLNRDVAIKVLLPAVANDPDRLARFKREAQVLASLNHPNIAHVHGLEDVDGIRALVMELVDGPTLADRIARLRAPGASARQAGMPIDEALSIAKQIAEALEEAHEQGIVHRDLKPANIKVRSDGTVKVLDFGLAKAMETNAGPGMRDPGAPAAGVPSAPHLTDSPTITSPALMTGVGVLLGTAAYMSPEQAQGLTVDTRSDVFSFGAVVYEMLTGCRLFQGDTAAAVIASVLIFEPDFAALPTGLNPRLTELLKRCLQKNPKKRWYAVADLRAEIETIAATPLAVPPSASPTLASGPLWRRTTSIAIAAVLSSGVGAAVAWRFRVPPNQAVVSFSMALPEGELFTRGPSIAVSPDGNRIVYVADQQIHIRDLADMESRILPGTKVDPLRPFFSPDGQWVGYFAFADRTLKKIRIGGGSAITLCKVSGTNPYGAFWYHDQIIFADAGRGILRVSEAGGEPVVLVGMTASAVAEGPRMLDDDTLMFTMTTESGASRWDRAQVIVQELRSGRRTVIVNGGTGLSVFGRHLLYAVGNTVLAVPFDSRRHETTGGPVPVVEGVTRAVNPAGQSGLTALALSDTGTLVYVPGAASVARALAFIDRTGKVEPLQIPPKPYQHPRISPNGEELAVATTDRTESAIWIYNLKAGGTLRQLTLEGRNLFPIWTPDGHSITFQSDREGDRGIFQQPADGGRAAERLLKAEPDVSYAPETWTPDGKTLIYRVTAPGTNFSLRTFTLGTASSKPFEEKASRQQANASLSPDSRWIAYSAQETTTASPHVFIQTFPPTRTGGIFPLPSDVAASPRWSRDGSQIYYDDGFASGRLRVLDVIRSASGLNFGNASTVPATDMMKPSPGWRPYDVTPDDSRLIVVTNSASGVAHPAMNVVVNWGEELASKVPVK